MQEFYGVLMQHFIGCYLLLILTLYPKHYCKVCISIHYCNEWHDSWVDFCHPSWISFFADHWCRWVKLYKRIAFFAVLLNLFQVHNKIQYILYKLLKHKTYQINTQECRIIRVVISCGFLKYLFMLKILRR